MSSRPLPAKHSARLWLLSAALCLAALFVVAITASAHAEGTPSVVQIDFACEGAGGHVCVDVQLKSVPQTPVAATLTLYEGNTVVATATPSLTKIDNITCFSVNGVSGQPYHVTISTSLAGRTVSDTHTLPASCVGPTPTPTPPTPTPTPTPTTPRGGPTPTPTPTPPQTPHEASTPPHDAPTPTPKPPDAPSAPHPAPASSQSKAAQPNFPETGANPNG